MFKAFLRLDWVYHIQLSVNFQLRVIIWVTFTHFSGVYQIVYHALPHSFSPKVQLRSCQVDGPGGGRESVGLVLGWGGLRLEMGKPSSMRRKLVWMRIYLHVNPYPWISLDQVLTGLPLYFERENDDQPLLGVFQMGRFVVDVFCLEAWLQASQDKETLQSNMKLLRKFCQEGDTYIVYMVVGSKGFNFRPNHRFW